MRTIIVLFFISVALVSCQKYQKFRILNSEYTGIDFINKVEETDSLHVMSYEYIYNGAGVGIGDLNNDSLPDIVFAGNQVSPRVYLNTGNFKFRDITANFRGLNNNQWYSGVAIADVNCDGWSDVYLTSTASNNRDKCKNRLWINEGIKDGSDPFFSEMSEKYGVDEDGQSVSAAFLDYDRDGDLDLYVLNNTLNSRMNTSYRAKVNDGTAPNNDRLYRNNGDGTFTDVTVEAGITYEGFGLGVAVGDVNKDGYPDIYITNDYISNDLFYINQRDGTFRNEIRKYLSYQSKSSMGNDMADVNNDGNPDIFTLDMMPEYYYKKRQTINGFSYIFYVNDDKYNYEHQFLRNMLHVHNGFIKGEMLPYSEIGQMAGVYQTEWSWSPLFADYDNDGDKDLLVANGYPRDMTDKDWTFYKVRVYGTLADEKHVIEMTPAVKVPNVIYENKGNLRFTKRKDWLPEVPSYSYGASFVDLDNDGDLDYVANNLNDKAFILRNYTVEKSGKNANYIKIKLVGEGCNTMAIGAKIEIWHNGKYQFLEHFLTRGYASSVDPVVHFGLSKDTRVDSLKITWPTTGNASVLKEISVNKTLIIHESGSTPEHKIPDSEKSGRLLFEKNDRVISYTHEQSDFIDFFLNQNIIPHKFSQIGPVMAKGDINADGIEDIVIGATNIQPTKVFVRTDNRFSEAYYEGLTFKKEIVESDIAIFDADNDGDNDVIILAGGYENSKESEYQHYLYRNEKGIFTREVLPVPPFPASVVRQCDFDRDGDMDIFIGARVKRGMFPFADNSWLLVNENGRFTVKPFSELNIGMVTDAVWSDFDNDGWTDLLVAREWNSILVLKNRNGNDFTPAKVNDTENYHGIWYSIIAGDFDNDGDDDYIAGNLGENHRFTVSSKYPLSVYHIDFDLNGSIDPVVTAYWQDPNNRMREYPVNYFDELRTQLPLLDKQFESYSAFSYATFEDMFGKEAAGKKDNKLSANTTSSYVIWNGEGGLRFERLPDQIQVSPARKMLVRDLNNDAFPDVIVTGNDYKYDISTGYYDANKGLVMISKGREQKFDILTPSQSGFILNGMVESLLLFEGDTTIVIAGINRNKASSFRLIKP